MEDIMFIDFCMVFEHLCQVSAETPKGYAGYFALGFCLHIVVLLPIHLSILPLNQKYMENC